MTRRRIVKKLSRGTSKVLSNVLWRIVFGKENGFNDKDTLCFSNLLMSIKLQEYNVMK